MKCGCSKFCSSVNTAGIRTAAGISLLSVSGVRMAASYIIPPVFIFLCWLLFRRWSLESFFLALFFFFFCWRWRVVILQYRMWDCKGIKQSVILPFEDELSWQFYATVVLVIPWQESPLEYLFCTVWRMIAVEMFRQAVPQGGSYYTECT